MLYCRDTNRPCSNISLTGWEGEKYSLCLTSSLTGAGEVFAAQKTSSRKLQQDILMLDAVAVLSLVYTSPASELHYQRNLQVRTHKDNRGRGIFPCREFKDTDYVNSRPIRTSYCPLVYRPTTDNFSQREPHVQLRKGSIQLRKGGVAAGFCTVGVC